MAGLKLGRRYVVGRVAVHWRDWGTVGMGGGVGLPASACFGSGLQDGPRSTLMGGSGRCNHTSYRLDDHNKDTIYNHKKDILQDTLTYYNI